MTGRKRGPDPRYEPEASEEYEKLWVEAFKLTENIGKWSAKRAAVLLGPRASVNGGNSILNRNYRSRQKNARD